MSFNVEILQLNRYFVNAYIFYYVDHLIHFFFFLPSSEEHIFIDCSIACCKLIVVSLTVSVSPTLRPLRHSASLMRDAEAEMLK